MIVGRAREFTEIRGALESALASAGSALCIAGEPGIGKSAILAAAADAASEFRLLRVTGDEGAVAISYLGVADVVTALRPYLSSIPPTQQLAIERALGWGEVTEADPRSVADPRYLIAAGVLSLVCAAATDRPILIVADDWQWVDQQSRVVLTFLARRVQHDRVCLLLGTRDPKTAPGITVLHLEGLRPPDARALLQGFVAPGVLDRLMSDTAGNPLQLLEFAGKLSPAQRRGSAALPTVLPLTDRLADGFRQLLSRLPADTRRTLLMAALERRAGIVISALESEGVDGRAAIENTERSGHLALDADYLVFRSPVMRSIIWAETPPAQRRSAHKSLADAPMSSPEQQLRHRAAAVVGYDERLSAELAQLASIERGRSGFAAASALMERSAQICADPSYSWDRLARAIEDAFAGGDVARVESLADTVLSEPVDPHTRGRVLLCLGKLEQYAGSVRRAGELLTQATRIGAPGTQMHAAAELAMVSYRLGDRVMMSAAADTVGERATLANPEEEMLAHYTKGAALAVTGRWQQAYEPAAMALHILETNPALREAPEHLAHALLAVGWMREPLRAAEFVDRRLDRARKLGALGLLPFPLTLLAGGAATVGRHDLAYAWAGEAVELGVELGYVADVAIAHELLAWQCAARGLPTQAEHSLAEAYRLEAVAEVNNAAVHIELVDGFVALCRGDPTRVVQVLERRIRIDGGRLPRGDHPLGVAPDLVEAYLSLGRRSAAAELARQYGVLHAGSADNDILALAARLQGMTSGEATESTARFDQSHALHALGSNTFEAARTHLLHGARLRRDGARIASRSQLEIASRSFEAMGFAYWAARANAELDATGRTARRVKRGGAAAGDPLTSQETRVALLVARGLTNREIAESLFLSQKTVEHHVTSALRKRGARSRTELALVIAAEAGE